MDTVPLTMLKTRSTWLPSTIVPFAPAPRLKDVTWVRPELVAQIAYAEWTADGKLRQPAFLGLRTDKKAREVTWARRE